MKITMPVEEDKIYWFFIKDGKQYGISFDLNKYKENPEAFYFEAEAIVRNAYKQWKELSTNKKLKKRS